MSFRSCESVRVLEIVPVGQSHSGDDFFELRLEMPNWDAWKPGQFVMIRPVGWPLDLMWGRPFSICSADADSLTLFIQRVGRGTARLAELKPGDEVTVWGPLGNGFAMEPETPTLLLAGGIGIAPFRGYVEQHPTPSNVKLFFAHRMPLGCYPFERFSGCDSSTNMREEKPEDLQSIIAALDSQIAEYAENGLILCCGPTPFMRTAQQFALKHGARLQVSLENKMACGVGGCLGCVTKDDKDHNVQVCTQGPVFWADKVKL